MENLKELTECILFEKDNQEKLGDCIQGMQDIYEAHTGIKASELPSDGIELPSGLAISPLQAAACLLEVKRTAIFLRGIYKAIVQLKKDFQHQKINILYAGCGPYATLVTPLTTMFTEDELTYYLLDINEESLGSVEKLYKSLGVNGYIKEMICADAATYLLPENNIIHLVISETMQKALVQEPQMAIMLNLIPQMAAHTIFIPEEISISIKLLNLEEEREGDYAEAPERIDLGQLYSISMKNCQAPTSHSVYIPKHTGKCTSLNLLTDITVYKDERLHIYDCSLNRPLIIEDAKDMNNRRMKFWYEMGIAPKFCHDWGEWIINH